MLTQATSSCELTIRELRLWVSLGCSPEERSIPQPVDIDINIQFPEAPLGCKTDQLSDVDCYQVLVEHIIASLEGQSFNLVEFLTAKIFDAVTEKITAEDAIIEISLTKLHHPVMHVQKGITFKYSRRLPQTSLSL